ncbi:DUF2958 domain-containing protein [Jiella pacifica]|uniref:DUF2958 domain-containing protein n=1 Tax=Jiella pacifica TaxID=2696469 RepID=A0A6N9TC76_9HYPH|nr:DUF2958 domain-containing protein [Jiella pacifica]
MKLITQEQRNRLIANFRANQQGPTEQDHWPVVRLFTPDAGATWLFTEFDPIEELFFGLCDLGMGFPELGYVSLAEITGLRGRLGLPVERDRHWEARGPLSAYAEAARKADRITEPEGRHKPPSSSLLFIDCSCYLRAIRISWLS